MQIREICFGFVLAPSLFDPARQWMNQSGEPCLVQHESNPTKKGGSNGRWAGKGQWVNQSGEPSAKHCPMSRLSEWFLGSLVTTSTSGWHTVAAQTSSNQMTRKWEFGSGFCRLATRRLKRHKRVEFHTHNRVDFHKDAMPLDLLISIQDGAGYAFNSIDKRMKD